MNITIDTSIILAVACGEPSRQRAIELTSGHALIAPKSLHWEVGNALSAMLKRQRITAAQANLCIDSYRQIPIKLIDVDLKQAINLVKKLRIYAYDAYMLACAQQWATPLLTLDDAFKTHAEGLGIAVMEV